MEDWLYDNTIYYKWITKATEELPVDKYQTLIDYLCTIPDELLEYGVALSGALIRANFDAFKNCNLDKWTSKFGEYAVSKTFKAKMK